MIKLNHLHNEIDNEVEIEAWVLNLRKQGKKLCFLSLYDGTGTLQATLKKNQLPEGKFELINNIYRGASLMLKGSIKEDVRAPEGFEMQASDITVLHPSGETFDQEITPESGVDVKLSKRYA